jgi:hypothetical protein
MHPALNKLNIPDPEQRQAAAESFLERYTRKQLHGKDTTIVLNELIAFAIQEDDLDVQLTLLEALDMALMYFEGDLVNDIAWATLIAALPKLHDEALQLALPMLSLCGRADAKSILEGYPAVQESASFALDELDLNA